MLTKVLPDRGVNLEGLRLHSPSLVKRSVLIQISDQTRYFPATLTAECWDRHLQRTSSYVLYIRYTSSYLG
ncbi:hypothetical protein RRG08_000476 [Elysia crispata]|uniref:Uncharacterized protein n=1 Tax=Elysia crispata TaxID=231223 RepID=A0AAE0YCD2_9GAST|nr:hypothetical protein RRG08_000476 [Elysia crispata]